MGSLKPGATYIHERVDNVVYAREFGADPSTRQAVGWDFDKDNPNFDPRESKILGMPVKQVGELVAIAREAEHNPTLKEALERLKILYHLSKNDGNKE
jgi:hypothetical protein